MTLSIRSREDGLFSRWRKGRADFYPDGIASEAHFEEAPVKLLFLMKEVNDPPKTSGMTDLRDFLHGGARWQSWNEITRWVEGIHHLRRTGEILPWSEFPTLSKADGDRRAAALRQICAVNIKKSAGTHTAKKKSIAAAAKADADFIREQLDLYEPDLTICCGTDVTKAVVGNRLLKLGKAERTARGVRYFQSDKHGVVFDFSHPEARVSSNLLLYGLLDAVAEVKGWGAA